MANDIGGERRWKRQDGGGGKGVDTTNNERPKGEKPGEGDPRRG